MNQNSSRSPAERIPKSEESSKFGVEFPVSSDFPRSFFTHDDFWKGERQIEFVLPPTIMAITAQLAFHRSSTPIGSPTALVRDGDIEIDDNSC